MSAPRAIPPTAMLSGPPTALRDGVRHPRDAPRSGRGGRSMAGAGGRHAPVPTHTPKAGMLGRGAAVIGPRIYREPPQQGSHLCDCL